MADVNVSFGLDAQELFAALKNVSSATSQTLQKLEQDTRKLGDSLITNMAKGTTGVANSKRELSGFIDENKKALVAMQLNGEAGTDAYKLIADQVKKAQAEVAKIDDAAKKVDASLGNLGDGGGAAAGKIGGIFGGITDKIPGLSGGIGNLGGSFQSLAGGVTGLVPGLGSLTGVLAGGGITAGIAALGAGLAYSIDKGKEFETQLASLSSITGVSGDGLTDLGDKAKIMAAKFGTDASANIDAFKTILSKLGPDIAKSPEALNSMAESVNTLSKATGDTPGAATEALTGALLQFGVDLGDPKNAADAMAVAMNTLAAGAKFGASEVPEVAAAINVAGVAASKSKVSFEETNSAIQILAAGGKVGAEAGTSLRNVLNKLGEGRFLPKDTAKELKAAGVDINKLGDTSIKFSERLRELNKISADAALTTKLFGTDAAAASILIKGANGPMDELTKNVTGTKTATEQAAINMDTFGEKLARIKSNVDNFAIAFYDGMKMSFGMLTDAIGPSVNKAMASIGDVFSRVWGILQPILLAIGGLVMTSLTIAFDVASQAIRIAFDVITSIFDSVFNSIKPIGDAFMNLGKTIGDALGLGGEAGKSIDFMELFKTALSKIGEVISFVGGLISGVLSGAITFLLTPLQLAGQSIAFVITKITEWIKQSGILQTVIEAVTSVIEFFQGIIKSIENAFFSVVRAINDLIGFWREMDTIIGGSAGIWNGFQNALDSVWQIIKNVGNAIYEFGVTTINKYLIEPINMGIEVITNIANKIIEWVKSFGAVQGAIKIITDIGAGISDFFGNIGKYVDIIKVAIGGIVSAINEVGKLANDFFSNISKANFAGAYDVVTNSITRIKEAYTEGENVAKKYIEVQKQQEAQALKTAGALGTAADNAKKAADKQQVLNDFIKTTDTGDTKPPPKGDEEKPEKAKTEYQKLRALYDQYAKGLEIARDTEFANFKGTEEQKSKALGDRLKVDSEKLNAYLNEQFQKQKTTQFIDTPVVIRPQGDNETAIDIQKFYIDTFLKNREVVDKQAAAQLKEQLKREEELRKETVKKAEEDYKKLSDIIASDIKQNTAAIATVIPNIGAITQSEFEEAKKNIDDYVETLRLKNKFIEDQLVNAQIAGADKAAAELQKQLDSNNELYKQAQKKTEAYIDATQVSLQKNTLENVAAIAIQNGLYSAFLDNRTKQEREAAEKAREAKLNGLKKEEDDLAKSLAKREISFDEYQAKLSEIQDKRNAENIQKTSDWDEILKKLKKSTEVAIGEIAKTESAKIIQNAEKKQADITKAETELATAQRKLSRTKKDDLEAYAAAEKEVTEKSAALAKLDDKTYGLRTAVVEEFAGRAIETFGALAASGKANLGDFGKAALQIAVDLLKKQIPIFAAQIFGTTVGQLGLPGILVAAGLTISLEALANEAMAGFKTGGYTGDVGESDVAGVVHGKEYVLNAQATRANRDVLEWANRTNKPLQEYYKNHVIEKSQTAISNSGELILEVQKLREETRNLGVQIRRNTQVEIHGNLVADSKSINAVIDSNKRKQMRRG